MALTAPALARMHVLFWSRSCKRHAREPNGIAGGGKQGLVGACPPSSGPKRATVPVQCAPTLDMSTKKCQGPARRSSGTVLCSAVPSADPYSVFFRCDFLWLGTGIEGRLTREAKNCED